MNQAITGHVELDVHATSTAVSFAAAGWGKPRFVGTVGTKPAQLTRALAHLGEPTSLVVVYEAGPGGYTLARELTQSAVPCRFARSISRLRSGRSHGVPSSGYATAIVASASGACSTTRSAWPSPANCSALSGTSDSTLPLKVDA